MVTRNLFKIFAPTVVVCSNPTMQSPKVDFPCDVVRASNWHCSIRAIYRSYRSNGRGSWCLSVFRTAGRPCLDIGCTPVAILGA